jgi:uncharacterized damage-inducible protein DinB
MSNEQAFVKYSAEKLEQHMGRIEACVAKLRPEQLWARHSENENAIGNLLLHLTGNVRQWILSGVGGDVDARQRQTEFDARSGSAGDLRSVVEAASKVIRGLSAARLAERVTIQGYEVSVLEAVYHVVEHFSGHAGQIVFATKFLTGEDLGFHGHLRVVRPHTEKTP